MKRLVHLACFTNVPVVSYAIPKEEVDDDDDDDDGGGEILGGTGYGRWGRVFLFSKSTPSCDTDTTQNLPFDIARLPLRAKWPDSWLSR